MSNENGWTEWSKFVLKELERLNTCYRDIDKKMGKLQNEVTILNVKAGAWGLLGGILSATAIILFHLAKNL